MSTRAIGTVLGVGHQTVMRDLSSGGPDGPPAADPESSPAPEPVEVEDIAPVPAPKSWPRTPKGDPPPGYVEGSDGKPVRVVTIEGEPWFVLADLRRVLDLSTPARVAERIDDDMKGVSQIHTPGGRQNMSIVSEPGMYEVVIRSDKPAAVARGRRLMPTLVSAGQVWDEGVKRAPRPNSESGFRVAVLRGVDPIAQLADELLVAVARHACPDGGAVGAYELVIGCLDQESSATKIRS